MGRVCDFWGWGWALVFGFELRVEGSMVRIWSLVFRVQCLRSMV